MNYHSNRSYTGKGIGVAVLDTGCYPHQDISKIVAFRDFVNHRTVPYDDSGHGTHICGLISSKKTGIAPNSHLIIGKVLDHNGNGKIPNIIDALEWIRVNRFQYNIRILNISVGTPASGPEDENSPLVHKVNQLWNDGIVVVVAAGNNGPHSMTVTMPGISRKVITVGSYDTAQDRKGNRKNASDLPKHFSGRGPTVSCIMKPDLIAPGTNIYSCSNTENGYTYKSGTSMSTPIVSGAIALLLEKNPGLKNWEVKLRLHDTCRDLGLSKRQQGWGMLDIPALLSN